MRGDTQSDVSVAPPGRWCTSWGWRRGRSWRRSSWPARCRRRCTWAGSHWSLGLRPAGLKVVTWLHQMSVFNFIAGNFTWKQRIKIILRTFLSENVFLAAISCFWYNYKERWTLLNISQDNLSWTNLDLSPVDTVAWSHFLMQLSTRGIKFKGEHWEPLATFSNCLISLTDYYQKICVGRSLEQGSLAWYLTPELSTGGQVHVPQDDPRLGALVLLKLTRLLVIIISQCVAHNTPIICCKNEK